MRKVILFFILFCLVQKVINCQDNFRGLKFDLSVRYRFELWDGMNAKDYGDDSPDAIGKLNDKILLQKIITGATYTWSEKLNVAFHLQDSRAFGWSLRNTIYPDLYKISGEEMESQWYIMNPQEEFFEIYDLYMEYKGIRNLSVKAGRQKIFFGDYRIFEPSTWGNAGRWTWDAIKISYKKNNTSIDIFGGGTKINDPFKISLPFTNTEFWGGGLYSHFRLTDWLEFEPFYALKTEGSAEYMKSQSIFRNWTGLRILSPEHQNLIYDIIYALESGKEQGKQIKAFGACLRTGYRFGSMPAKPSFSFDYAYATGGNGSSDLIHTFDPAYGSRARFYGRMSIVTWSNISKPGFIIELSPLLEKMWIQMKYNSFYIPEPEECLILNTMKIIKGKHHLGDEADIYISYQPSDAWQFTGVMGYFNPGDIEDINLRTPGDAFLFSLQILFTL